MSEPIGAKEELQQTADMLEQILEAMPGDLVTLRALYETSLKMALPEKALDCLVRLDAAARAAHNAEVIAFVIEQYASIADELPEVRMRMERLQEHQLPGGLAGSKVPEKPSAKRKGGLESEMALAWDLLQDEQLSQEEYSSVMHDLTETLARDVSGSVTVLHALADRNFNRIERLMAHLSQKSGVPIVSISRFADREELHTVLPSEFLDQHAALPFAQVGGDLLLAVLNPQDKELVKLASQLSGRRCHAYLVTAQEYDSRLASIKKS